MQRKSFLFAFNVSRWYPFRRTSWKLSRFLYDLLLNNASSRCKVVPFGYIIMACPDPSMILTGPDIVWTFALRNVKFVKYSLPRRIECVVALSSKQTSSFISIILIFALILISTTIKIRDYFYVKQTCADNVLRTTSQLSQLLK